MKNEISIYKLYDPREPNIVRYIGKTVKKLSNRLQEHITESKGFLNNTYKNRWIKSLLNNNIFPKIELVEIATADNWQEREKYLIAFYKTFTNKLTNLAEGGEGMGIPSSETRRKLSISHKGRKLSEETRRKQRQRCLLQAKEGNNLQK